MDITFRAAGAVATVALMAVSPTAQARDDIRTQRVQFAPGASSAMIAGRIRGYQAIDYVLRASAGQTMTVSLRTSNSANYFNVLPPGSTAAAIFIGSTSGMRYSGTLARSGDYRIRVYLMRSAARRKETARYTLTVGVTSGRAARFDARGTMPCSIGRPSYDRRCAWTVRRNRPGGAVIRIVRPDAKTRVLRFARGEFTSGRATVRVRKESDFWVVTVNGREFYRFADAVITGG